MTSGVENLAFKHMAFLRLLLFLGLLGHLVAARSALADEVLAIRTSVSGSPYREHAPLAWFSVGSLAVGGIFYGIQSSFDYPGATRASGNGVEVNMAIGAAGATALAAGAAYFWYAWRGQPTDTRTQALSAGFAPDGSVSAKISFPLSSLAE